ncbi:hypothetical protein HMPREF3039_02664 [Akkermansia sp. KLE1798]|nr:hypothetical protein HMPREF3039_02664 [Akkermansia sp. KLE1798]
MHVPLTRWCRRRVPASRIWRRGRCRVSGSRKITPISTFYAGCYFCQVGGNF